MVRLRTEPSALRLSIRFLSGAIAPAIKRLKRVAVTANELTQPPAADPQRRWARYEGKLQSEGGNREHETR